jgi:SHS2 domain-containing protein
VPFRFLPDIAIADVAFEASGKDLTELFQSAALATFEVMVDTSQVRPKKTWSIKSKATDTETLLFDFLSQLVALKDQEAIILGQFEIQIKNSPFRRNLVNHINHQLEYHLTAQVSGEPIKQGKHDLRTDVKAVTLHLFKITKNQKGFTATVVLDV